jgi:hypothetical protein
MKASKTRLNSKIMPIDLAEKVEEMIVGNSHSVFRTPFRFTAITNHIPGTSCLTAKKNLFKNIKAYFEDVIDENPWSIMPRSFHFCELKGYEVDFFKHIVTTDPKKLWILKPGENSSKCEGIEILPAIKVLPRLK